MPSFCSAFAEASRASGFPPDTLLTDRSPNPLFIERRNILGRLQSEKISLHVTPEEKKAMVERMKEAVSPSMRAFILDMCMNGKIIASAPRNIVPL